MANESCDKSKCASCDLDCPSRKSPQDLREPPNKLSSIKHVIGIISGKGGVGKSLVTSLLAVSLQKRGFRVGILDADITGPSIPKMFGLSGQLKGNDDGMFPAMSQTGIGVVSTNLLLEEEDRPLVWRGPVIAGVVKQFWQETIWDQYDYLLVDCPPGTGDVPLTVFQSLPVDGIIIVSSPQSLVSMIVSKAANMAQIMHVPVLGLVENMSYVSCPDCGKEIRVFGDSHIEEVAEHFGYDVLARLPIDPKLAALCDAGQIESADCSALDGAAGEIVKITTGVTGASS